MEVNIRRRVNWIESSCLWEMGNDDANKQAATCKLKRVEIYEWNI